MVQMPQQCTAELNCVEKKLKAAARDVQASARIFVVAQNAIYIEQGTSKGFKEKRQPMLQSNQQLPFPPASVENWTYLHGLDTIPRTLQSGELPHYHP